MKPYYAAAACDDPEHLERTAQARLAQDHSPESR